MKKLLFLLAYIPVQVWSQDTLVTPVYAPLNTLDTAVFTIAATNNAAEFRFLHPIRGNAFWNTESMALHLIDSYGLTPGSNAFAITSSIADFYKRHDLHVNSELVQNTTNHPGSALSTVDHWSLQCGNYADKVANLATAITGVLEIPDILFRRVSLSGHQIMEYRDSALHQWIYMDPDPGTAVCIPRNAGNLVSFSEIQASPGILLDPTTSTWWNIVPDDSLSRQQYYDFMLPLLDSVQYFEPNYISDERDMLYRLPTGAVMRFTVVNDKLSLPIDSFAGPAIGLMNDCMIAFMSGNSPGISACLAGLATTFGYNQQFVLNSVMNGNAFVTHDGTTVVGPKDSERFCSITLPAGTYTHADLLVPNTLRSIEPEHAGTVTVNGTMYTDTTRFQFFWPSGTTYLGNPQAIDPGTIQCGLDTVIIPDSVGSVTCTFYFNHKMFSFWEQQHRILVYEGELAMNGSEPTQAALGTQDETPTVFNAYPNPTQGAVTMSQTADSITVFSITGSVVAQMTNASTIDISSLQSGLYILQACISQKNYITKIIKN